MFDYFCPCSIENKVIQIHGVNRNRGVRVCMCVCVCEFKRVLVSVRVRTRLSDFVHRKCMNNFIAFITKQIKTHEIELVSPDRCVPLYLPVHGGICPDDFTET